MEERKMREENREQKSGGQLCDHLLIYYQRYNHLLSFYAGDDISVDLPQRLCRYSGDKILDLLCDCNWYGSDCRNIGADYAVD